MWGYVIGTFALLGMCSGVFYAGVTYGDIRTTAVYADKALKNATAVIGDLQQQIEAKDGSVEKAQADMVKMQDDLDAIRRSAGSVGSQLRTALNATSMGTCLLDDPVRGVRADNSQATAAAARDANRARDPG
jgi:peptidoglycan hydrolase CwlO-like protein